MDYRNRDKALNKTRKVFRKDAEGQHPYSSDVKRADAPKGNGRKVSPNFEQTIEQDMQKKGPAKKYGFSTCPNAFQEFSAPTSFDLDPALVQAMGVHARSFQDLYGNVRIDFTQPAGRMIQQEALQYSHMLRQQQARNSKNIHKIFEEWMVINKRDLQPEVIVETAKFLRFGSIL